MQVESDNLDITFDTAASETLPGLIQRIESWLNCGQGATAVVVASNSVLQQVVELELGLENDLKALPEGHPLTSPVQWLVSAYTVLRRTLEELGFLVAKDAPQAVGSVLERLQSSAAALAELQDMIDSIRSQYALICPRCVVPASETMAQCWTCGSFLVYPDPNGVPFREVHVAEEWANVYRIAQEMATGYLPPQAILSVTPPLWEALDALEQSLSEDEAPDLREALEQARRGLESMEAFATTREVEHLNLGWSDISTVSSHIRQWTDTVGSSNQG